MKRLLMPIAILLLLIPGLVLGCDGEAIERDEAIVFYEGAYPIGQEIRDVADDWNIFLNAVEGGASDEDIIVMCNECQSRLEVLQDDLSLLYAPSPLRELKNNLTLCLTTGIEGFILEQQCILEGDIDYCIQGDEKLLELNSLLMVVADEWDDGIAHYEIEASEVLH